MEFMGCEGVVQEVSGRFWEVLEVLKNFRSSRGFVKFKRFERGFRSVLGNRKFTVVS